MDNQKKYLRVTEIMEAAAKKAQEDPLFQEAEKECVLDYQKVDFYNGLDELRLCSFNVIGHTEYGTSEGIYGEIEFYGVWLPYHRSFHSPVKLSVYTLKSLSESKEAFIRMGTLVNLICYYAIQFINANIDRFD